MASPCSGSCASRRLRGASICFRSVSWVYSIFLWHGFIILADTPIRFDGLGGIAGRMTIHSDNGMGTFIGVYAPAVLLYSAVSYAVIERPFRRVGR